MGIQWVLARKRAENTLRASLFCFPGGTCVLFLLPAGSGLSRGDMESGHKMCAQTGTEYLQVGNVHLQYVLNQAGRNTTR